jgi:hypothetical protein
MLGCLFGSGVFPYTADEFWSSLDGRMAPSWIETNATAFLSGAEMGRSFRSVRGSDEPEDRY